MNFISESNNFVTFMGNSNQRIELKIDEQFQKLFGFLLKPRSIIEINDFIQKNKIDEQTLIEFANDGLLTLNSIDKQGIFSRHESFWSLYYNHNFQEEISKKTVLIYGCGGIGNNVIQMISRMGIGKLILIDGDVVELSNLTRQVLFEVEDVGCLKVEVIKKKIKKFSSTSVIGFAKFIETTDDLKKLIENIKIDFVVLSADSGVHLQEIAYEVFSKNKIPFTVCGYANDLMISGPIIDDFSEKFEKAINETKKQISSVELILDYQSNFYITPSFGPINAFISSYTVIEMIKYWMPDMHPETYFNRVQIDFINMSKNIYHFK